MPAQLVHRPKVPHVEKAYFDYASEGWSKFPDKTAVIDVFTGEEVTFRELKARVEQLAGKLQKLGVRSQSRVQYHCDNALSSLVAQQASWFCNATVFNFKPNRTMKYSEYKHQTENAEIEFVITDGVNYDVAVHEMLRDPESRVKNIIIVNGMPKKPFNDSRVVFADKLPQGKYERPQGVRIKEDIVMVSYTSGSTGPPKGVMHSNFNMVTSFRMMILLGFCNETDRFLQISTLTYITGMLFSCSPLANGATVILASHDIDPDFPVYVERHKATISFFLECPMKAVIQNVPRFPNFKQMISTLRLVIAGGTVFPKHLRGQIAKSFAGKKFVNLFGQTEAMGSVAATEPSDEMEKHCGFAAPHMTLRVVTDDGRYVEVEEPGELQWKTPTLTLGYWKREMDDVTEDGYFTTGDVAVIDSEGRLEIVGRKKHFIICLDERVSPTEIEDVVLKHPGVAEVVVVGTPHPEVDEAPTAMVIVDAAYKRSAKFNKEKFCKEIVDLVASQLSDFKQLHGGVHIVDELEMTESGKYSRPEITKKAIKLSNLSVEAHHGLR